MHYSSGAAFLKHLQASLESFQVDEMITKLKRHKHKSLESFTLKDYRFTSSKEGNLCVRHLRQINILHSIHIENVESPGSFYGDLSFLLQLKSIRSFYLCKIPIPLISMTRIARLLPKRTQLKICRLVNCALTAEHIKHLASALSEITLDELSLSNNCFGDQGIHFLQSALMHTDITYLGLGNCGLTNTGAKTLSVILKHNTSIKTLFLGNGLIEDTRSLNTINDKGIIALSRSLQNNITLKTLHLPKLPLTPTGIITASQLLFECTQLNRVIFYGCLVRETLSSTDHTPAPRPTLEVACWKEMSEAFQKKSAHWIHNPFYFYSYDTSDVMNGGLPFSPLENIKKTLALKAKETKRPWPLTEEINAFKQIQTYNDTINTRVIFNRKGDKTFLENNAKQQVSQFFSFLKALENKDSIYNMDTLDKKFEAEHIIRICYYISEYFHKIMFKKVDYCIEYRPSEFLEVARLFKKLYQKNSSQVEAYWKNMAQTTPEKWDGLLLTFKELLRLANAAQMTEHYVPAFDLFTLVNIMTGKRTRFRTIKEHACMGIHTVAQTLWKEAKAGHTERQYQLAYCLDKGIGFQKNTILSNKFYMLASEQGHQKALEKVYFPEIENHDICLSVPKSLPSIQAQFTQEQCNAACDASYQEAPRHSQITAGNINTIQEIITHSTDSINKIYWGPLLPSTVLQHMKTPPTTGPTLLHHACKAQQIDTARLLIQNGASLYSIDDKGYTPLRHFKDQGCRIALTKDHALVVQNDAEREQILQNHLMIFRKYPTVIPLIAQYAQVSSVLRKSRLEMPL